MRASPSPWAPPGGPDDGALGSASAGASLPVNSDDVDGQEPLPSYRARRRPPPVVVSSLLLAVLAVTLVVLNVTVSRGISPYDEATHVDYALQVSQGQLPATGDPLSQEVLGEWACRGSATGSLPLPPCGDGPYEPAAFPAMGSQYNSAHPPLYYAATGFVAQAVSSLTGAGFLDAARLTGIGWLTSGLWVLLAALRRLGASWTLGTAVAALVGLAPSVMHATSTVNNDAAAILAGALALWVTLRVVHGASSWPAFAAAAVFVAALKLVFVIALVPGGLVLLLMLLRSRPARPRLVRVLVAGMLAAGGTIVAWSLLQASRGMPELLNPVLGINTRTADRVPVAATVDNLLDVWPPVARPFLQTGLDQPQVALWVALITLLFASAPLIGVVGQRHLLGRDLSLGAGLGLLCVPVAVQLHTFVRYGEYLPGVAPRYGLCLVPALALALASVIRGRTADRGVALLAGLGTVGVVTGLLVG